ncbi:MAG: hypothetical protein GEU96_01520, partial [Propionibacteriales bacterium]|nr:hypothetical protein [Propionibacteriales bacterium]
MLPRLDGAGRTRPRRWPHPPRGLIPMAVIALALYATYFLLAVALRTIIQVRRTGDSGFRGLSGRPGSAQWWAGVLFVAAIVPGVAAPVAAIAGLPPVAVLDRPAVAVTGAVLAVCGILATVAAQLSMGESWRIGVGEAERTTLVTGGPFGSVRNPIFTAMAVTGLGLTLAVPNAVA